jgi:hypothetical protein
MLKKIYTNKLILPQQTKITSVKAPVYRSTLLFFDMYDLPVCRISSDIIKKLLDLPLSYVISKAYHKIEYENVEMIDVYLKEDYAEAWDKMPEEFKPYIHRIFNKMLFSYANDFVMEYKLSPSK